MEHAVNRSGNPKPILALIGGIGSGKSFVAEQMALHGGFPIFADRLAHDALRQPEIRERILSEFGEQVQGADGEIDRKRMAKIVFASPGMRQRLQEIVFPWIRSEVEQSIDLARADSRVKFIALDAPVILEAGWTDMVDRFVFIRTPREVQLRRLAERGWSTEEILAREQSQMPVDQKERFADAVIDNGTSREETVREIEKLLERWKLN